MNRTVLLTVLSLALGILVVGVFGAGTASAQPVSYSNEEAQAAFYDPLEPYGTWVLIPSYGWCWYPYGVPVDWRPYRDGRWLDTDDGWMFESEAPWGWACYHYGRWFWNDDYGWCWWPDTVWGPSWVAWRTSGDWIGWAPLPPRFIWHVGVGFGSTSIDFDAYIPSHSYCFVQYSHFLGSNVSVFCVLPAQNVIIIRETRIFIYFDEDEHHHVRNRMHDDDRRRIERAEGHSIERYRLQDADSPDKEGASGKDLKVFRPDVRTKEGRDRVRRLPEVTANKPPELAHRHEKQVKELQAHHEARQKDLEDRQRQEIARPPAGIKPNKIRERHEVEQKALAEEKQREDRLVQQEQTREVRQRLAPKAPSPRERFRFEEKSPPSRESAPAAESGRTKSETSGDHGAKSETTRRSGGDTKADTSGDRSDKKDDTSGDRGGRDQRK